jgi:hypothetical protein
MYTGLMLELSLFEMPRRSWLRVRFALTDAFSRVLKVWSTLKRPAVRSRPVFGAIPS